MTSDLAYEIETFNDEDAVRLRCIGPYSISAPQAWNTLRNWMLEAGLEPRVRRMIGYGLDDPSQVAANDLRYDACLVIDGVDDLDLSDGIERCRIPGGRFAVHRLKGPYAQIGPTMMRLHTVVQTTTDAQIDYSRPFIEIYHNGPHNAAQDDFLTDLCIPLAETAS